jgi:glycogen synthase
MKTNKLTLMMTTDAVGGVWTYAMELCRALPEVEFILANMGPAPGTARLAELGHLENVRLFARPYALEWQEDPWNDIVAGGRWLMELERRYHPDVIHLNGYVHAALPWRNPVIVVAHSCVLSWWRAVKREPVPALWRRYARAVAAGLRAADLVIAPSRAMASTLEACHGFSGARVISNGISGSGLGHTGAKENLILCAARLWDEGKNARCLAKAAAGLPWPVVLAGDPGGGEHLLPNVDFAGECDRTGMMSWFRRAAVYAHPARYEPFGLAPLEAACAGCALVLADIPSLREIWGKAAVFVNPDDPVAWHGALAALIADPCARERMAERARRKARSYSAERMARSYHQCYLQFSGTPVAIS